MRCRRLPSVLRQDLCLWLRRPGRAGRPVPGAQEAGATACSFGITGSNREPCEFGGGGACLGAQSTEAELCGLCELVLGSARKIGVHFLGQGPWKPTTKAQDLVSK